jgi:hypothetical protein
MSSPRFAGHAPLSAAAAWRQLAASRDLRGARRRRVECIGFAALALALVAACRSQDPPSARDNPLTHDAAVVDAAVPTDAAPPADAAAAPPAPTKLVAGGDSTCAVLADRTVRCWGGNGHGQLGDGQTEDSATPVAPAIHAVVDLQLADATACALLDDASVACWGRIAWHGRAEDTRKPTGVLGVIGVKRIFVLPGRACARLANDSLVCWGAVDARGHFADGAARVPTPVVGLDHVAGLIASGAFSDDGRAWHWGSDGIPRRIDAAGVQEIAAHDGAVCARLEGGRVVCVDSGRCGPPPTPTPAPPPAPPPPITPAPATPAKSAHGKPAAPAAPAKNAAAKPAAGAAAKSGPGASKSATGAAAKPGAPAGKPGAPAAAKPAAPAESQGDPVLTPGFAAARQLAFDLGFCVVTTVGRLQCGDGCRKLEPIVLERVGSVNARCAQLRAGTISCSDGTRFIAVPGVEHATSLAVGRAHACAIAGGAVLCWGDNGHGQLGPFAVHR